MPQLILYLLIATDPRMPWVIRAIYAVIFSAWWLGDVIRERPPVGIPLNDNGRVRYISL